MHYRISLLLLIHATLFLACSGGERKPAQKPVNEPAVTYDQVAAESAAVLN